MSRPRRLPIAFIVLVALALGVYLVARGILGSDLVRSALEQQLAARLGQPVHIGSATAAVFPRVAVDLNDVSIGDPVAVRLGRISVITGLRGLFSRRIEDAEIVVASSRLALPLPFALMPAASATRGQPSAPSAFTVTSIRRIAVRDVELAAGNQTLRIDADSSIDGDRLDISRLTARGKTTRGEASGTLASKARMAGQFDAKADPLDLDELLVVGSAFATPTRAPPAEPAARAVTRAETAPMRITIRMTAPRGQFGAYVFRDLSTAIDVTPGRMALAPLAVKVFGGSFQGRLEADTGGSIPRLRLNGRMNAVDVSEVMTAAGAPGSMTGRLSGTVSIAADGSDAGALMRTARGTIVATIVDGTIPHLDMVRSIVLAFGKPSGVPPKGSGSAFSRLGGTFEVSNGAVASDDLTLASRDFDLHGRGRMRMGTGAIDAQADVILSPELTAQAGTDLRRYARQNGQVVVPATIGGTIEQPAVSIDVAAASRRALENELKRKAKSLLDQLLKKKKGGG